MPEQDGAVDASDLFQSLNRLCMRLGSKHVPVRVVEANVSWRDELLQGPTSTEPSCSGQFSFSLNQMLHCFHISTIRGLDLDLNIVQESVADFGVMVPSIHTINGLTELS
jgi:hypothetical protein